MSQRANNVDRVRGHAERSRLGRNSRTVVSLEARDAATAALSAVPLDDQAGAREAAHPDSASVHQPRCAAVRLPSDHGRGQRPHAPARGRAAGRTDHRLGTGARRGWQAGAAHARGALAVQCRGTVSPSARPASGTARSELQRRGPNGHRRRRALPVHHDQARRLSLAKSSERLASGAHSFFAVRPLHRDAARHADVLSRTTRCSPTIPIYQSIHGRAGAGTAGLQIRPRA